MKVIALWQEPVLPNPGSRVIRPVWARSWVMSTASSPSEPSMTGSSNFRSPNVSVAVRLQGRGVPFQLGEEAADGPLAAIARRLAVGVKGVLGLRKGEERRDARHPQLGEHRAELHRGPDAPERPAGIADDGRGLEE